MAKSIIVFSNDPKQPQLTLKISGTVELIAGFKPSRLNLGNVKRGSKTERLVRLDGTKAKELQLSEIAADRPDHLKVEQTPEGLKVIFTAPEKKGRFGGSFTAKTNLKEPARLQLFISAEVTGDIVPDRKYAVFTPWSEKQPPKYVLNVTSLSKRPFKITKIEDPNGLVGGDLSKTDRGWRVTLRLLHEPKNRFGKVKLLTDRKDEPSVELSYSVRSNQRHPNRLLPKGTKPPVRAPLKLRKKPQLIDWKGKKSPKKAPKPTQPR